ncbi:MAG: hypothetical protein WKF59_11750 [Chitinophagaceae bacterium]
MKNIKDYMESGILEQYVLGITTKEENEEISQLALTNFEVREEIKISHQLLKIMPRRTLLFLTRRLSHS